MCAGLKDKSAVTEQEVCVAGESAARLRRANSHFKGLALGDFEYCDKPLQLGEHAGNRFTLVLRHVSLGPQVARVSLWQAHA